MARVSIEQFRGRKKGRLSDRANAAKGKLNIDASRLAVAAENRISIRLLPFRPVFTDKRLDNNMTSTVGRQLRYDQCERMMVGV